MSGILFTNEKIRDDNAQVIHDPWWSWRIFQEDPDAKMVCFLDVYPTDETPRTLDIEGTRYYRGKSAILSQAFCDAVYGYKKATLLHVREYHPDSQKGIDFKPQRN